MPAAIAPGRANGLYVVVVGEGLRVPFLRGGVQHSRVSPSESISTGGYIKVGLHHKWITVGLHPLSVNLCVRSPV